MNKLTPKDLFFLILMLLGILSYMYLDPPEIKNNSSSFDLVSAQNHLKEIASVPHPIGTKEHDAASAYIRKQIESKNFEYSQQNAIVKNDWGGYIRFVNITNHLALHKGNNSDGIIVLVAHYDSQPNTPGASDDGAPVASMLTLMEKVQQTEHDNDILFLFTDGEEMGLNGAKHFAAEYERKDEIKYLFNFEARGNSGPVFAFETTGNNNSIVKDMGDLDHLFGSSLMYEIYKIMPNDTDFTHFKKMDINGVNFALVDGYVNYHSMTDNPANMNPNTHFHHGILMSQLIDKYKNGSLSQEHKHDLSYFNVFGSVLVSYKPMWNLILLIISLGLMIFYVRKNPVGKIGAKKLLAGMSASIIILLLVGLAVFIVNYLILQYYPHYGVYYSNNFYNGPSYLVPFIGLASCIAIGVLRWMEEKYDNLDIATHYGGIALFFIGGLASYMFIRSGSNFLIVPLFLFLLMQSIGLLVYKKQQPIFNLLSAIGPFLLWIPLLYLFFVAFSLSNPYISIVLYTLLVLLIYPAFKGLNKAWMWLFFGMLVLGLIRANGSSGINPSQPYQAQMYYLQNMNTNERLLVSDDDILDFFEEKHMVKPERRRLYEGYGSQSLISGTKLKFTDPTILRVKRDTIDNQELIRIKVGSKKDVISTKFTFSGIKNIQINKETITVDHDRFRTLEYIGDITDEPIEISFNRTFQQKPLFRISLTQRGLIETIDKTGIIIPGPGNRGGAIIHSTEINW